MTDFREGGHFAPPPYPRTAPKMPILNRVNILSLERSKFKKPAPLDFIEDILLSKASRTFYLPSKKLYKFLRTINFSCFFSEPFGFLFFLKFKISTNKWI